MAEDKDQRTEAPSSRRLEKARLEEGQVPHSRELSTFALLIASGAGLWAMGSHLMGYLSDMMTRGLVFERALAFGDPLLMLRRFYFLTSKTLLEFLPFMGLLIIVILASPQLMGGWVFSFKKLRLNLGALNPFVGLSRMFSVNGFVELGKATLKALLVGGVAAFVIWHNKAVFFDLVREPLKMALAHLGQMVAVSFLEIVASMLLIVAVDV
ncbi:MAG TPA: EscU/YscU/HrcU family type III secretion system export apparatus switch protein, partial [Burkholderiales bacterium]|nr:EscU/YscU/HrcU family type III secretion system export apparatus switch protein [Burkholderiales bacterium]